MPRNSDLLNLGNLGPGQVPNGAVEDVSLKNPDRDTLPLSAHINDPSRAHMASSIGIVDAGGYYSSDEVEGALQEVGGAFSGGRQNGVVTGFGYSAINRTVTFNTPSTVLLPTLRDYSGEVITLPDNTPSIWVYISPATGLITQLIGLNPPSITSPENILLWRFSTFGNAITAATDARLYVRNIDRKLPFTVRSFGPQADQESEACFVTLDAALLYTRFTAPLGGLRTEIVIRGPVTTGAVDFATSMDGLHFRGEDGATITLTSGSYLFNLNGRIGVTFTDIAFQTDVAGATAFVDLLGGAQVYLDRCEISSGTSPWQAGMVLTNTTETVTVKNSSLLVTNTGISISTPNGALIEHTSVTGINFIAGSIGIRVGVSPTTNTENPSTVRSCQVTGFDLGVVVSGNGHVVSGCSIVPGIGGGYGIQILESQDVTISENRVDCTLNGGKRGIQANGSSVAQVTGLKVIGNTVLGAADWGIRLIGFVQESTVIGNVVDCYLPATPEDPTAKAGIHLQAFGAITDVPAYVTVSGNIVWRAQSGIYVAGFGPLQLTSEVVISNNEVHHCAVGVVGVPSAFETSLGIYASWCTGVSVVGNNIYGIGSILKPDGTVVQPTAVDVYAKGIALENCEKGTIQNNKVRDLAQKGGGKSEGISLISVANSFPVSISGNAITGNSVSNFPGAGIYCGVGSSSATQTSDLTGTLISENTIGDVNEGVVVISLGKSVVSGIRVSENIVNGTLASHGIEINAAAALLAVPDGIISGIEVAGNTVLKSAGKGLYFECGVGASLSQIRVNNNVVTQPSLDGIYFQGGDLVGFNAPNVFSGFEVSGNQVSMDPASVNTSGIELSAVTTGFKEADFSNNTVSDGFDGVKFLLVGPGPSDTTASSVRVSWNTVVGARASGITFNGGSTLSESEFSGNRISNSPGSTQCLALILAKAVASAAQSSNITISDNLLQAVSGVSAILCDMSGMKATNLRVEGNSIVGGSLGTQVSISNSSSGIVPSVNGLVVRKNNYSQTESNGVQIVSSSSADELLNFDVSENTFNDVAGTAGAFSHASVYMSLQSEVRNLVIRDNQFYSCGLFNSSDGGVTLFLNNANNIAVTGNQFTGSTVNPSGFENSVILKGNSAGGYVLRGADISRNTVRNVSLSNSSLFRAHIAIDLAKFSDVYKLSVIDNSIDRTLGSFGVSNIGIAIWGSSTNVYDLRVEGNQVSGADAATPITQTAISLLPGTLTDGSVSNNTIRGTSSIDAQGSGITLNSSGNIKQLIVSGNKVLGDVGAANYAISVSTPTGIPLNSAIIDGNIVYGYLTNIHVSTGSSTNLIISNNESGGHQNYGIYCDSTGSGSIVSNLRVSGNIAQTNASTQTAAVCVITSDTNSFENLSVVDNQVRYSGVTPAYASGNGLTITSGDNITNATISRNSVLAVDTGISVTSVTAYGVAIDDNNLQEGMLGISHFNYVDIIEYSVSRNRIWCRADSTAEGLIYVFFNSANHAFHNASIDGNDINGGFTVAGSTWGGKSAITVGTSGAEPNVISASISDNAIRLAGNGVVTAFASSRSLSVDRNKADRIKQTGLKVVTASGASVGDTSEVSVSGNLVTRWQQETSGTIRYGVSVRADSAATNSAWGVSVIGNSVKGDESSSAGYDMTFNCHNLRALVFSGNISMLTGAAPTRAMFLTVGAGEIRNLSFTNNVFRGSVSGISYTSGGGTPQKCCVMGNIGDQAGSWSQFANGGGAGWLTGIPVLTSVPTLFTDLNKDDGT